MRPNIYIFLPLQSFKVSIYLKHFHLLDSSVTEKACKEVCLLTGICNKCMHGSGKQALECLLVEINFNNGEICVYTSVTFDAIISVILSWL